MLHYKFLTEKSENNNRYEYKVKLSGEFRTMTDICDQA